MHARLEKTLNPKNATSESDQGQVTCVGGVLGQKLGYDRGIHRSTG